MKVYLDSDEISDVIGAQTKTQSGTDGNVRYVSIYYPNAGKTEFYSTIFAADSSTVETGQFLVFKYRIPKTNTVSTSFFEFFTSTTAREAAEGHNFRITPIYDGEWHVVVVDVSSITNHKSFTPVDNKYIAQYIRADFFNEMSKNPADYNADTHVDFAYIGMDSSLEEILKINSDFEKITLYKNGVPSEIGTETGTEYEPEYVDPNSGYTEVVDHLFYGRLDSVNGTTLGKVTTSLNEYPLAISGVEITPELTLNLSGWCVTDGGIEAYVWSADGGKTWNIIDGSNALGNADSAIFASAQSNTQNRFTNQQADTKNGAFQEAKKLTIDLKAYEGETVNVIVSAISAKDTTKLIPLFVFKEVICSFDADSILDPSSAYTESNALFYSILDSVNEIKLSVRECSNSRGYLNCTTIDPDANSLMTLNGWAVVDGGISKYVWTADGGKTWYDCGGTPKDSYNAIVDLAKTRVEGTLNNPDSIKIKGCFQQEEERLIVDLKVLDRTSEPLTIYVAAVNAANESKVTVLYCFSGI